MKVALDAHITRANLAKEGNAVDRHLFGLHNLAKHKRQRLFGYELPKLFTDSSYFTLSSSVLSTSNVSAPFFDLFGFGPVIGNGLGLAYNIHDNELIFNITSFMNQQHNYSEILKKKFVVDEGCGHRKKAIILTCIVKQYFNLITLIF